MANREACELYIEQEIKAGLEEGKKPYSIGKELSAWVEKLFEVNIKPDTLKKRAERIKDDLGTNVPKKSQPTETITNPTPEIIKDRKPQGGGARPNAGRPKKEPELSICPKCGSEYSAGEECPYCRQESSGKKPKYIHTETHPVSTAIMISNIIISQLERIKIDDPKRQEAFRIIINWIEKNQQEG